MVTVVTKVLPMSVPDSPLGPMSSSLATTPELVHLTSFIPHLKYSLLWPQQKAPLAPDSHLLQFLLIHPELSHLLPSSQLPKVSLEVLKEDVLAGFLPIPGLYQLLNYPVVIDTCSKHSLTQDLRKWVASRRQDQIHPLGEAGFLRGGQRDQPCGGRDDGDHGFHQDFVCLSSKP